jgi:hypothetical protein
MTESSSSSALASSMTFRSSESRFDKLRLSSLTSRDREKLKRLMMIKMNQALKKKQERIIIYQDDRLRTNNMIKYLHSHVRFYIDDVSTKYSLNIHSSLRKSMKSTTNANILKLFCEITKNETKNKRWKKTKQVYKVRAKNACYLILLDIKSRKKNTLDYHLTNKYESRIALFKMWFIHEMIIAVQRNKEMRKIHKKHEDWKTNVMKTYFREFELYVLEKKDWKLNAILKIWEKLEIFWSTTISSFENLVKLASTNSDSENENYINMIEEENKSRIAANIYSNENEAEMSFDQNEAEIFANSFQIESKTTNSFVEWSSNWVEPELGRSILGLRRIEHRFFIRRVESSASVLFARIERIRVTVRRIELNKDFCSSDLNELKCLFNELNRT